MSLPQSNSACLNLSVQAILICKFACAITTGALISINVSALAKAKMSSVDEQHYREMTSSAKSLNKAKDWAKSREKYAEALELAKRSEDQDKQVKMLLRIAGTFVEQTDFAAAETNLRQALEIAEKRDEAEQAQIASCLYELASVLTKEKREAEAKPIFARCLEMSEKVFSANNPILAVRKGEYAAILGKLGQKAESDRLNAESQEVINAFMADMSKKIKEAWHQPPESFSYRIGVDYEVLNHGKVRDIEVTKSSGSAIADKAAVDAIKNGAPFSDIDSKDPDEKFTMAFSFDYNYHHGKGGPGSPPSSRNRQGQSNTFRQSREVKEETEAKLKAEKEKCAGLKEKIETALSKSTLEAADLNALADLYSDLAESLAVQGSYQEGVDTLTAAMAKDCFKKENSARLSLMVSLAHIHLYADDAKKAEPVLKEVVSAAEFSTVPLKVRQEAFEDYGNCLTKNHKFAEAQDFYSKARELK